MKWRFKMNTSYGNNFLVLQQNLFEKLEVAKLIHNFPAVMVSDFYSLLTKNSQLYLFKVYFIIISLFRITLSGAPFQFYPAPHIGVFFKKTTCVL